MNVLFFGTPDFAVPPLEALLAMPNARVGAVITQPDKPAGRGGVITPPPVKRVAMARGIPVFQPHSLKREFSTLQADLTDLGPFDIGVVVAFGQLLPVDVLEFPRHGCVNIHASLLPRWRGAAPIQRAIEAGDNETGICLMQMEAGLDTGPVFSTAKTAISPTDTAQTLHDRLASMGANLLVRDLENIVSGSRVAAPQPSDGVTYAAKITPHDCQIDWTKSAQEITRKIRAFSPHPGTFSMWEGRRIKIFAAREIKSSPPVTPLPPGTVISAAGGEITIQSGDHVIALDDLQLEGKKRMSAEEFLRGRSLVPGQRLGN